MRVSLCRSVFISAEFIPILFIAGKRYSVAIRPGKDKLAVFHAPCPIVFACLDAVIVSALRRNVVSIAELDFDGTIRHFKIHYHPGIRIGYDVALGGNLYRGDPGAIYRADGIAGIYCHHIFTGFKLCCIRDLLIGFRSRRKHGCGYDGN